MDWIAALDHGITPLICLVGYFITALRIERMRGEHERKFAVIFERLPARGKGARGEKKAASSKE